jgi:hypothetical protein
MSTNIETPNVNNPQPPRIVGAPMPQKKPAANYFDSSYGGMQQIDSSAMRQNYIARMSNVFNDTSNQKGLSAGGGQYNICLYDVVDKTRKDPYACGGPKRYKDAYGDSGGKGCVVNFDEY